MLTGGLGQRETFDDISRIGKPIGGGSWLVCENWKILWIYKHDHLVC